MEEADVVKLTSQSLVGRVLKEQGECRGPTLLLHLDRVERFEHLAVERLTLYLNRSLQKKIRHQSRPKFNDATVWQLTNYQNSLELESWMVEREACGWDLPTRSQECARMDTIIVRNRTVKLQTWDVGARLDSVFAIDWRGFRKGELYWLQGDTLSCCCEGDGALFRRLVCEHRVYSRQK